MNTPKAINWRVAAAGGAVVGVAIGGFVLANSNDPFLVPDGINLSPGEVPSEMSSTSAVSPLRAGTTLTLPATTAVSSDVDSPEAPRQANPPAPRQLDSVDSPRSADSPDSVDSPDSPDSVDSPDSPNSVDSPPSPPSPPSVDSPDSPPSPPSPSSPDIPASPPSPGSAGSS